MTDSIPTSVSEKFGDPSARPTIVRVYDPKRGWLDHAKRVPLTYRQVVRLREDGATLVEAKWKSQIRKVELLRIPLPPT